MVFDNTLVLADILRPSLETATTEILTRKFRRLASSYVKTVALIIRVHQGRDDTRTAYSERAQSR